MNKKLIALTLLAILAEESMTFASEYTYAPTYSNSTDCCPAPRPVCCARRRRTCRKMRSCCPRIFRRRSCSSPRAWRRRSCCRQACRPKRACCPRARCCRPRPACCPAPAPVCTAPACVTPAPVTTCATGSCEVATNGVAAPIVEGPVNGAMEPMMAEEPMEVAEEDVEL